jgi:endonuclease/exonuclease/phosphatase family metal-dependent hydrolase
MRIKPALLIVFCFGFLALTQGQDESKLKIMTFNIRYDNPEDGPQNWHNRKENVIKMLHFYDLDAIGMQEVLAHQLEYINTRLPEYEYVGFGREDGIDKGEFAPIFFKKSRFNHLDSGTFWLSSTPNTVSKGWDADLERIATWAILEDRESGKELLIINTHFDHRGNLARLESARLLKQRIKSLAGNRAVVLTGDFNLTPDAEGIQILTGNELGYSLKDTKFLAKFTYGPDWTTCGFDNRPFEDRKIIDYVFVEGIGEVLRYAVLAEMLNELYLSDHCPVLVELTF